MTNRITLQPGDYIATEGLSEDDYHAVAEAFMAAGATNAGIDLSDVGDLLGWDVRDNELYHGSDDSYYKQEVFTGRQLTLSQILSATNAGKPAPKETTTEEQQPIPQQHLADQLEAALVALEHAQSEVDRLQAEYRAAYPKIHGEVVPSEGCRRKSRGSGILSNVLTQKKKMNHHILQK